MIFMEFLTPSNKRRETSGLPPNDEYESMEVKVRTGIVFLFKMHQTPCLRALYSHYMLIGLDVQDDNFPGLEGEFII